MNDSSLLKKYFDTSGAKMPHDSREEDETHEVPGVFGYLRGTRERALILELRKKTGNIHAVSYAYLEYADFNPSQGIVLRVGGQEIRIRGRNLNTKIGDSVQLYSAIVRHRVNWIQEADQVTAMETRETAVLIESIEW